MPDRRAPGLSAWSQGKELWKVRRRHCPRASTNAATAQETRHPLRQRTAQSARDGTPGVYPDAKKLGAAAADHLLERGFRSLCYMGEIELHKHTAEVGRAFKDHAEEAGAACELLRVQNRSFLDTDFYLEIEKTISDWGARLHPPIALFAEEAPIARMVIQSCQELGWDVPRDIAVLSQHDLKSVVNVAPQISSIEIDNERAGYEAAKLLDRIMTGKSVLANPVMIPPKGVFGRESTDYLRSRTRWSPKRLRYIAAHLHAPACRASRVRTLGLIKTLQSRFSRARRRCQPEIRRLVSSGPTILADLSYTIAGRSGMRLWSAAVVQHRVSSRGRHHAKHTRTVNTDAHVIIANKSIQVSRPERSALSLFVCEVLWEI